MGNTYQSYNNTYSKLNTRRKKHRAVICCLALLVVIATLLALMLPADTTEQKAEVYQINKYSQAKTTLVYGGSVKDKLGSGMSFKYWDAVVIEKSVDGRLYVSQFITDSVSKTGYSAKSSDGFVLLLYNVNLELETGQIVTVDFDYKSTSGYNASAYGTVTFSTDNIDTPEKDNSDKLTVVSSADTRELIEVNLYDYGNNINDLYSSDNKYPGFQQERGSTNVGTALSQWASFNFGNNITSDIEAGLSRVTVADGTGINATTSKANRPISGAIKNVLGTDGFPALSDGTSLGYLFSDNTYAKKQNKQSINGLFRYNETTGAYTYNSRENHAQFNSADDTFTLYDQIITSNFMMYPFGNFLPFNDIVYASTQANKIDKSTFSATASRALNKYNSGYGSIYKTLSEQLNIFSSLMDKKHASGWSYTDCMNEYFSAAGVPKAFNPTKSEFDRELVDKLYSIDYDVATDFYFGMEMKMNFMQPKNGLTGKDGKQPMVFTFSGDDDVWVYLDDVLFLDLSGIHRHVGGEIDFVNGTVKYFELDPSTGDIGNEPYKTVKFSELVDESLLSSKGTFANYSMHTFNFYYIERGSGSGVCRMNFNFPLIRENSISVTKDLEADNGNMLNLLGNPDFSFQVMAADTNTPFISADKPYDVFDIAGNKLETRTTDKNGVFTLKAGQTAVFDSIAENTGQYYVRELLDENIFSQYGDIKVDGTSQTVDYGITIGEDKFNGINSPIKDISDGSTVFHFNNVITFKKLGGLSITKTLTDYIESASEESFSLYVELDNEPIPIGTPYTASGETKAVSQSGIITLKPNETAVFSNILAGTVFKIRETEESSDGYSVTYKIDGDTQSDDYASAVILPSTQTQISVNNTEKGIGVSIPIQKNLDSPDGKEHTYSFSLKQVTDESGKALASPFVTRELTLTIKDKAVTDNFTINYPLKALKNLPLTLYYKITEKSDTDSSTVFDSSVYIVAVSIRNDNGELVASISKIFKDGLELTDNNILFNNRIIRYELPATGAGGTHLYISGGLLMIFTSVTLLYIQYRRRKEKCVKR